MTIVAIAGQGRKVGKTSILCALIRGTRSRDWVAVKISTHEGTIPHAGNKSGIEELDNPSFALQADTEASPFSDTGRYLAAGARRAYWIRTRTESLKSALESLMAQLPPHACVLIESASVVDVLSPDLVLAVSDARRRSSKPSFLRALKRSDAVLTVALPAGAGMARRPFSVSSRPFGVERHKWTSPALLDYLRVQLRRCKPV